MSVKLKESCAACAASKIRCTKEKPTCKRCYRKGLTCEYQPSNRRGRIHALSLVDESVAPVNQTTRRTPSLQSINSTISAALTDLETRMQAHGMQYPSPPPGQQFKPLSPTQQHQPTAATMEWNVGSSIPLPVPASYPVTGLSPELAQWVDIPIASAAPMGDVPPLSPSSIPDLTTQTIEGQGMYLEGQFPFFPTIDGLTPIIMDHDMVQDPLPTALPPAAVVPAPQHEKSCLATVIHMMAKISHLDDPNYLLSHERTGSDLQYASLKEMIDESKSTIDTIGPMLECPCLQDEVVIVLLPLLVYQILSTYIDAGEDSLSASKLVDFNDFAPRSRRSSMEQNERQAKAALIMSGLHRVQRLINCISVRIAAIRSQSLSESSTAVVSEATLRRLELNMKTGIQSASMDILDMLRAC